MRRVLESIVVRYVDMSVCQREIILCRRTIITLIQAVSPFNGV
jgi:hypothetical protein